MFDWLRDIRRKGILADPFPDAWRETLEGNVAHWNNLDGDERTKLEQLVQVFVAEKNWEGCGGLELTDEIRVTIAGLACLLVLKLEHDLYRNVQSILVYPSTVNTRPQLASVSQGLVLEKPAVPIVGQAMRRGPVLLVWDKILHDAVHPERGHNVVFHEFAHKLDMLDGSVDGTPPIANREQYNRWVDVCSRRYERLKRRASQGKRTFLDTYGATNVGEFFAVATESFFSVPAELKRECEDLYSVLQEFYQQDPAE